MADTPTRSKRLAARWLLALLALAAAACGDDGEADGAAASDDKAEQEDVADEGDTEADATDDADATGEVDAADGNSDVSLEDAMADYSACMEDEGVDPASVPDAPSPEAMVEMGAAGAEVLPDDAAFGAAHAECWPALEAAIPDSGPDGTDGPPEDDELAQQIAGIVTCMNQRGYNFAETTEEDPYVLAPAEGADFDWEDPTAVQDRTECEAQVGLGDE